jgi:hypothetical protein
MTSSAEVTIVSARRDLTDQIPSMRPIMAASGTVTMTMASVCIASGHSWKMAR